MSSPTASQPVLDDPQDLTSLGFEHVTTAGLVSSGLLRRRLESLELFRHSRHILEGQVVHEVLLQAFKNFLLSQEGHVEVGDVCEDSPAYLGR